MEMGEEGGRERGRDREGLRAKEREEWRERGGRGRIVPVKFGEIPRCCVQKSQQRHKRTDARGGGTKREREGGMEREGERQGEREGERQGRETGRVGESCREKEGLGGKRRGRERERKREKEWEGGRGER